jgi:tripartite-type tricarboxylate transporter receptor subunit TctC
LPPPRELIADEQLGIGDSVVLWREDLMRFPRRKFLHLAAGAAALPVASRIAMAQTYPTRPVRLIVGFPPGGTGDILARLVGQWLSERLGQPFIIENRPGAASNIATEAAARAASDGYTLLLASVANAVNATLYQTLNYNFIRDIVPVATIASTPQVLDVNPSLPAKTVTEFILYAKANPGKLSMGSGGIGSPEHVAGELFEIMTGVNIVHVPYRGGAPAVADLLGGHLQVMFDVMPTSIGYIRTGKLRALAVTTATRSEALPALPTLSDFVPSYEASVWAGLCAPRNTPAAIIDKLNSEVNAMLADPKMRARFADLGATVLPGSPADFEKLIADETDKWGKVIRAANIKPE